MLTPRGSEVAQKPAPHLKTSSSNSDPLPNRSVTDRRSPKLGDHRSPNGAMSDSANQKKFGTRVSNLESQLGHAQEELKILKEQLASAESEKKAAQEKLKKKYKKPRAQYPETDVFEVPMEKIRVEPEVQLNQPYEESKPTSISMEPPSDVQVLTFDELALKDEIILLKSKLEEKEKELEVSLQENESLKSQLCETTSDMSTSRAREEKMSSSMIQLGQELDDSRVKEVELREKLETVQGAKDELESEMMKLRVQTEQWRKAADAAAAVLADGVEMNGRRISERGGSMGTKHIGSILEPTVAGYAGFVHSHSLGDDLEDDFGNEKRKGSGIRMFGDLWKKKGQK